MPEKLDSSPSSKLTSTSIDSAVANEYIGYRAPESVCGHSRKAWDVTTTIWPGETDTRHTWTCRVCGYIWGRA